MIKEPALYNEVNDFINSLNVEVKSFDENESEKYHAPAFVMKRFNNCVPYKVFYKNDDFEKYYLLHEYGHIYFAHINNEVLKENLIKTRLKYILPKEVSEEDFMRVFSMHIDNVTKDMEVNSKLFSDEEFEAFEKGTGHEYILPQRYGFPKGLEADTYLNLILMDLNKFMDEDKNRQQRKNDGNKDDQSSKSNGSGNGKSSSSSMSTEDYIDSIKKELEETSSVNENFESRVKQGDKDEAGESGNKASEGKQYKTKDEDVNIESDDDLKQFIRGIHTKKTKIVKKVDVERLSTYFNLIPVCPEVEGGLPTPRTPCEIIGDKVISKDGEDKTANYLLGASKVLARNQKVKYALLKEYSPSCGVHYIHNGKFDNGLVEGQGKTTSLLSKHNIKVFSENEIEELIKEVTSK